MKQSDGRRLTLEPQPASTISRDLAGTIDVWIANIDRGVRLMFPMRNWGKRPVVIDWLLASDSANAAWSEATTAQNLCMTAGTVRRDRDILAELWRKAEEQSTRCHRIEHSRNFEIFTKWLGIAFALCSDSDWTFEKLGRTLDV